MPRVLSQSSWNQSRPPSICARKEKTSSYKIQENPLSKVEAVCGSIRKCVHLEHGAGVNPREHNHSSSLKSSDPQTEPHLSTLAILCHSVFDVTVSRETKGGLTYTIRYRIIIRGR